MRSPLFLRLLFLVVCGALAGWFVGGVVPAPIRDDLLELRQEPYGARWDDKPFVIDDARRLSVPWHYADFDLQMDVELGEGVTLDLLVRQVEPRSIGSLREPFHGRFSVLRLSAKAPGEPWLTREQALLGDRSAGGAELAPGLTATVWVEARGRRVRANVAGKQLPWFTTEDEYGSQLFVARGGTAVLKSLIITPRGQPNEWLWSRWTWLAAGALVGALVAAIAVAVGANLFGPGIVLVAVAWWLARDHGPPLWHPPPATLLVMLAASACFALCLSPKRAVLALLGLGLLAVAPTLHVEERALDATFGPAAGPALSEAHAQLVRGQFMIHDRGPVAHRVFLLGGELLYHRATPEQHLESMLTGDLSVALAVALPRRVDVPCLSTVDGHTAQQWDLFTRFYTGYRPQVIVFGVPGDEGATDPATGQPRSSPAIVESTLAAAQRYCSEHGSKLVVFADERLPAEFRAVLTKAAASGTPLVIAAAGEDPAVLSKRLTTVIAPLLR